MGEVQGLDVVLTALKKPSILGCDTLGSVPVVLVPEKQMSHVLDL